MKWIDRLKVMCGNTKPLEKLPDPELVKEILSSTVKVRMGLVGWHRAKILETYESSNGKIYDCVVYRMEENDITYRGFSEEYVYFKKDNP